MQKRTQPEKSIKTDTVVWQLLEWR